MFQVTRNSNKLHVAILFLDSGFGKTSVTAHRYFSTYFSTITIYINIITIIISIITIIKLIIYYKLISYIHYKSIYPNMLTFFNIIISYIFNNRPSCNYPGKPAHYNYSNVSHSNIKKLEYYTSNKKI